MKMKLRIFWVLCITASLTTNSNAQSSPNDFLLTAFEDPQLIEYESQIDFLNQRQYRLSFGEEIELRYGNDERTLEDARYQLRFRPSNPWRIRRNNALFNARKEAISLRQSLEFKEALYNRYSTMLEYLFAEKEIELSRKRFELSQRKVQLFEETIQSDLFDARDYVDAKLESIEVLEDLDDLQVDARQTQQKIKIILAIDDFDWNEFELISPDRIQSEMDDLISRSFNAADISYLKQQIEVARLETSMERADFDIGFIQAEYAPFQNNGDNELGFAFGITIPIFKNNKDQIAERILDEIEVESELALEMYRDSMNKVLETSFLTDYISHHNQLLSEIENLNIDELGTNLAIAEDFNPIALLELEEGKLKLEELVLKSYERLIEHYINFLFALDALQQQPLRNYLSNELSYIE
jgi:hypothetical protein